MSTEQNNKAVVLTLYNEVLNKKKLELLDQIIGDEFVGVGGVKGAAGFAGTVTELLKAFPDIEYHIKSILAENDKVAVYWSWNGTQTAAFNKIPVTGKAITNEGMAIFTLADGKIIGALVQTDRLGFLQGLGILPAEIGAPPGAAKTSGKGNGQINFIDRFLIPAAAIPQFRSRIKINRDFIKTLPGFIHDAAYEYTDANNDLVVITVATWASREALEKAKEAVQAAYSKEGFDPAAMFRQYNITAERGIYTEVEN